MSKVICHIPGRISIFICLITLLSCSKDDSIPYSDTPEIELIGVSHDTLVQYDETLVLTIRYKDGDGDIGFESPDKYALFVRDTRLATFDNFYIGPVAPPGANVPVTGVIDIEFPNLFLFGNGKAEKTFFEIKMLDRSGHESNVLLTDEVIIIRE